MRKKISQLASVGPGCGGLGAGTGVCALIGNVKTQTASCCLSGGIEKEEE